MSNTVKALLFDLDDTLVASAHLERQRRSRDRAGLEAALPDLRAPEGLPEALGSLAGHCALGIVTTAPGWYARAVLAHLYPGVRWGALVTYGDVRERKPHPEGLLLALGQLGVASPAEAAYVGDQDHDLEAARRAGMHPVRATWCGGLARAQDERVLRHPNELRTLIPQRSQPAETNVHTQRLLAYSRLPGVGRKTLLELLPDLAAGREPRHRRLGAALAQGGAWEQAAQAAEDILASCAAHGIQLLSPLDPRYPADLHGMRGEQPALLYVRGRLPHGPAITVIGTREPTRHGVEITRRISKHFASRGHSVVSGLALGVDAAAHQAALDAGGHTVAVLAHGLHTVVPRQHHLLAEQILARDGALVSEYPPGVEVRPPFFVERDRIQAGLSGGTVLIQTDLQGGSWHACRATLRYGRPLAYPVPTAADVEAGAPKITGLQLLERGTDEERRMQLGCGPDALKKIMRLTGRQDYPGLERQMEGEEARDGAPLFTL
ncbi:HAD-IA family hydrolase [Deinococcus budaensis]|uniref:DNA protecting protein DprA n=1 Tax=Deinococcus budaensis TaxID=1665626 RepID=A0A7W8GH47_9DEIO|nr:HAD-IA family hydrolase [Deinococcus budaensis]MBB5235517.1 DNA protecting protein DprA [Deinococcus budaensis]